jgi:predicted GNAT family acetyltransferase
MNCTLYNDPVAFLGVCRPALEANEAVYNLMLGISIRLVKNPMYYGDRPLLAAVTDAGKLDLAALMTPPYKLQIALFNAGSFESIKLLASKLYKNGWHIPGVISEIETARIFATHWSKIARKAIREGMRQRIYELRKVNPVQFPDGTFRQATIEDLDRATKWSHSFHADCFGDSEHPKIDDYQIKSIIEEGNLFFWSDPEPVSMAGLTRPTPHGISVSYVYTPPEFRGRGYASAVVARLSQRCLEAGREFCTLYTDLSNPTSNSIYQRIGYKAVADVTDLYFTDVKDD